MRTGNVIILISSQRRNRLLYPAQYRHSQNQKQPESTTYEMYRRWLNREAIRANGLLLQYMVLLST